MGTRTACGEIDDETDRIIRRKSWALAHSAGFVPDDQEDLEQELRLDLLLRLPHFDPTRGRRHPFVLRLIDNKIANLVEARRTGKRDYRREAFSLNAEFELEDGETIERAEVLHPDHIDLSARDPAPELHDLQVDVARGIYGLSPRFAALCRLLAEPERRNLKRLSEETGIPRGALYALMGEIRKSFEQNGLGDYP
jgi:RNA polymerase sigma-70 factor (ECF subfamily)